MNRTNRKIQRTDAFTATELILVFGCLALLLVLLLPSLARMKARSSRIGCGNNLKQMGLAFKTWALDNDQRYPMQVPATNGGSMESGTAKLVSLTFQVMSNELATPKVLVCPNDTQRKPATNFLNDLGDKKLSYFVGLDATATESAGWLCGDRNFKNVSTPPTALLLLTTNSSLGWSRQIHRQKGNLCFADGSVDQVTNNSLPQIIRSLNHTNRLLVP